MNHPLPTPGEQGSGRATPVVFAVHDGDGRYWLNTAVAITSVAQHATRPISIHVVHDDSLGETARRRLAEIARALGVPLQFRAERTPPLLTGAKLGKFSPASAFRLMIPELFADDDLVIYLDSDLVANGLDITELVEETPDEAPIAAVPDPFFSMAREHVDHLRGLGIDPARYFNSGVLALRPRLLPKDLLQAFVDFVAGSARLMHPDQDFLNQRFGGAVHLLDERFNTAIGVIDRRAMKPLSFYRGRILHYVGELKPMTGAVSSAFIPFLAHAHLVPEIVGGEYYAPSMYLFPVEGRANTLRGKPVDQDPGAEVLYAQWARIDRNLPARLKTFLTQVEPLRVYADFSGAMELRWRSRTGREAVLAIVDTYARVRTEACHAAASAMGRPEAAEAYQAALAGIVPDGQLARAPAGPRLTSRGQPPRLADLLAQADGWAAAIADYAAALGAG